jgi:hypothetical protein
MKRKNQSVSTRQQTRRKNLKIEIPVIEQQKQVQQPSRPTTFFPPDFHLQSFPQYLLQQQKQKQKQVVVKKKPIWIKEWQDRGYMFNIE